MTFLIDYTVYNKAGEILKTGKMRVKNNINSADAQVRLEKYFIKTYGSFGRLVVHKCKEDFDIPDFFKDILK